MRELGFADALLGWYDSNARDLPWRIGPGQIAAGDRPDPYRVWLSEIMLQQTTVVVVKDYFNRFTNRWPTVGALARASDADVMAQWAGLGYYARARNMVKCAHLIAGEHGGQFPQTYDALLKLPGIGPYTAAAIAAIAHGARDPVVDGNVERVLSRYFALQDTLNLTRPRIRELAQSLTPPNRCGDYAQAIMDLGATICTPRTPQCPTCPVAQNCQARAQGIQTELPRKPIKPAKPTRFGIIYVARRSDGAWLLERRPPKGLLGGMLGWPGSDWGTSPQTSPPINADWHTLNSVVKHTFTHFHLQLSVQTAQVSHQTRPLQGNFVPAPEFQRSDLPTVMRKAYDAALPMLQMN